LKISTIIPTLNRVDCLKNALESIIDQRYKPFEVIIVDQSDNSIVREFFNSKKQEFILNNIKLIYAKQSIKSLAMARNFGVWIAKGDWISFLDDDVILDKNYYFEMKTYIIENSDKVILHGLIENIKLNNSPFGKIEGFIKKIFRLENNMNCYGFLYPSFFGNLPTEFSEPINCMWASGCNMFVKYSVAKSFKFDEKLTSYSFAEDKDFSYRVYKKYTNGLIALPGAKLQHLETPAARIQSIKLYYMRVVYIYYLFLKNIDINYYNVLIFTLSRIGLMLIYLVPRIRIKRKPHFEFKLINHLCAEFFALKHLKSLKKYNLEFFNEWYKAN